jgi:DinB superfamily/Pentapeptide repeats (9 copies)
MTIENPPEPIAARVEDPDFSGVRFHGPNFENSVVTDGWFVNADFSGDVEGLRINGVEVHPLIEAELNRRSPERVLLRATDPKALAKTWTMLDAMWKTSISRARSLPEPWLYERVNEEWSFVETLRHMIMATDCWHGRMIRGEPHPYHRWGLAGSFLTEPESLGLDVTATPSLDEVLVVRQEHFDDVGTTISSLTDAELERMCQPPSTPGHPNQPRTVLNCLHVILNEEWEHNGYVNRDLEILAERLK